MGLSILEYIWKKVATELSKKVNLSGTNTMDTDAVISWGTGYTTINKSSVTKAVWNDYADVIDVQDRLKIIPGKCYCYDDTFEKYHESSKYMDTFCVGICSDTAGFFTGGTPGCNHLPIAISGFTLAYVDKIYSSGTPLVCTKDGYLTEIRDLDIPMHSHEIVAHYWKPEFNEFWGPKDVPISVNGRHWVKIR